jgi:hypothetical protein
MKAGKSLFLNALFGANILKTDNESETRGLTKISHSKEIKFL